MYLLLKISPCVLVIGSPNLVSSCLVRNTGSIWSAPFPTWFRMILNSDFFAMQGESPVPSFGVKVIRIDQCAFDVKNESLRQGRSIILIITHANHARKKKSTRIANFKMLFAIAGRFAYFQVHKININQPRKQPVRHRIAGHKVC